jgi:glycosyltransferase involved in cell wall biosynthesis
VVEDLIRDFRIPRWKVRVLYNPLDIERIRQLSKQDVPLDLRDGVPVVACTSRFERQKGVDYLIKAFAVVRREIPSKLVLIGDGTQRQTLERIASALNVKDDIIFVGYDANPFRWLRLATVFVLPSLYEGFPNALVEAMALGLPVISTACPHGPSEILEEGRAGLLVPAADAPALAEGILKVLKDAALRARLSEAAKRRATEFSAEKWVGIYEQLFCQVAGASCS